MGDVDQHIERARSLARHAAEREWLADAYNKLDRQKRVLDALAVARENLWISTDLEINDLAELQTHAARVVIAQCDSIMRHSGLAGLNDDAPMEPTTSGQEAAQEESLPW